MVDIDVVMTFLWPACIAIHVANRPSGIALLPMEMVSVISEVLRKQSERKRKLFVMAGNVLLSSLARDYLPRFRRSR